LRTKRPEGSGTDGTILTRAAHFHVLLLSSSHFSAAALSHVPAYDFATIGCARGAKGAQVALSLARVPSVSDLPPDTLVCRPATRRRQRRRRWRWHAWRLSRLLVRAADTKGRGVEGIRASHAEHAVSVLKWRLECRLDGDGEAGEAGSCHWTRRRRASHSSKIPVTEG
jgi:hypothetical protein